MARLSIQQLRGLKDLIQDGIAAGINAVEKTHRAIARQPYTVLGKIPVIKAPAQAVECIEGAITKGVYQTIRVATQVTGVVATEVIDRLEERERSQK